MKQTIRIYNKRVFNKKVLSIKQVIVSDRKVCSTNKRLILQKKEIELWGIERVELREWKKFRKSCKENKSVDFFDRRTMDCFVRKWKTIYFERNSSYFDIQL